MKQGFFRHSPMLLAVLLLAACASYAQQRPAATPANPAKASQAMNTTCKNLAPVNNIDDLLYQMHSNLDSHCLFRMPAAELERIWGIRVFGGDGYTDWNDFSTLDKQTEEIRNHNETANALYIERRIYLDGQQRESGKITVSATPAYLERHQGGLGGSLSVAYHLPVHLPKPDNVQQAPAHLITQPHPEGDFRALDNAAGTPEHSEYQTSSRYWWFHSSRNRDYPYLELETSHYKKPDSVILHFSARGAEHIFDRH